MALVSFDEDQNMTDPRNIAHDKRVQHEKKHHSNAADKASFAIHRPGRKPHMQHPNPEPGPERDTLVEQTGMEPEEQKQEELKH